MLGTKAHGERMQETDQHHNPTDVFAYVAGSNECSLFCDLVFFLRIGTHKLPLTTCASSRMHLCFFISYSCWWQTFTRTHPRRGMWLGSLCSGEWGSLGVFTASKSWPAKSLMSYLLYAIKCALNMLGAALSRQWCVDMTIKLMNCTTCYSLEGYRLQPKYTKGHEIITIKCQH